MRGYNKKYIKCLLVEPLTPSSPLPLCGIPTAIFFVKVEGD